MNINHVKDITHTDINNNSFIDRNFPKSMLPYLKIMRADRPIGTWLLLIPGLWAIALASDNIFEFQSLKTIILFFIGAFLMRGAGCVINDIWDRNIDAKVERTKVRPIPSGDITIFKALVFLSFLLSISLIILLQFNLLTIILGFVSIIPIIIYPLMKRVTWWPQIFLGFVFSWGAFMGFTAIASELNYIIIPLYIAAIFWVIGYDTIYAHQDKEDDLLIGVKSSALYLGDKSKLWIAIFYSITMALLILITFISKANIYNIALLIPAMAHMIWQLKTWDINSGKDSLSKFKSNKYFGILVFIALAVNF